MIAGVTSSRSQFQRLTTARFACFPKKISGSGLRVFARSHGEDSDGNGL
jgi:hypothetical protein